MSQVKNLRAMFENKGDESTPPDRGRSPGPPWQGSTPSDSPRPLSKVRTNFVAIEKDGRMGLHRSDSHDSSPSRTRPGTGMDDAPTSNAPLEDLGSTPRKLFTSNAQPEAITAALSTLSLDAAEATPGKSSQVSEKQTEDQSSSSLAKVNPGEKSPTRGTRSKAQAAVTTDKTKTSEDTTGTSGSKKKASTTRSTNVPTKPTTGGPLRSAANAKTSTGPSKSTATRQAAKPQEKPAARRPAAPGTRTLPATKQSGVVPSRKPPPVKTGHAQDTGFVKPKPKSPTKPVSLPASLMAPTASSVSKGGASRQSLSRQSGNLQPTNAAGRAPSRASVSTTGASTNKTIKRKPSTINSSRPSFGPPPRQASQDQPEGKRSSQVDEGFLARMMRPTQSSSSKTNEKTATPPRRLAARPSTSTDASSRRASSSKRQAKGISPASEQRTSLAVDDLPATSPDPVPEAAESATMERPTTPPTVEPEEGPVSLEPPVADESEVVEGNEDSPTKTEHIAEAPTEEITESEQEPRLGEEAAVSVAQAEPADEILDSAENVGSSEVLATPEDADPEPTPVPEPQVETLEEESYEVEPQPKESADAEDEPEAPASVPGLQSLSEPDNEVNVASLPATTETHRDDTEQHSVTEDLTSPDVEKGVEEDAPLSTNPQPSDGVPREGSVEVDHDDKA